MTRLALVLLLAGCGPRSDMLTVHTDPAHADVFDEYVYFTGHPRIGLDVNDNVKARGRGLHAVIDPKALKGCDGCYELVKVDDHTVEVRAGDVLGAQYGLTALLEGMGFRFFHPHHIIGPADLEMPADKSLFGVKHEPEIARRGLHLHTLHPTDAMMDFWIPGEEEELRARSVIDWAIRNRANHIQWVGLDDIQSGEADVKAWQAHTEKLNEVAHARGMTTGLGVQLFGSGNLQNAWDLVDDAGSPAAEDAEMRARLEVVDVGFDVLNLSFGEFFGEDPETFIDATNRAYDAMQDAVGPVDVPAVVHVGNYDDLRVQYQGEELLYYFLAAKTDRPITPWIHSVMYYNLFEDAGGAYLHDEFDEHREFLLDALQAGEPVGYFPETAYWVAFDINVPQYLPVYVRSRWTDLDQIRAAGPQVQDHVIFSSGWEWGYWQNDYAALRMSYETPDRYEDLFEEMYAPLGEEGEALSRATIALADVQHRGLIEQRLAAYMAGREAVIDVGRNVGIVSQPDRPSFPEIVAYDATERAAFDSTLSDLEAFASDIRAIEVAFKDVDNTLSFVQEAADGAEIDALRAEFALEVFSAANEHGRGNDPAQHLAAAADLLQDARTVVGQRHADLNDPEPERLIASELENPTIYPFGYLAKAEELCFWERELVQVTNEVTGSTDPVPPCI